MSRVILFALLLPEASEAGSGPQLPRLGLLLTRYLECSLKLFFRFDGVIAAFDKQEFAFLPMKFGLKDSLAVSGGIVEQLIDIITFPRYVSGDVLYYYRKTSMNRARSNRLGVGIPPLTILAGISWRLPINEHSVALQYR